MMSEDDRVGRGFRRKASGMKPREHWWVMTAIILLALGTFVGFTRTAQNFDDHEKLDAQSCERALKNREILSATIEALVADPGGRTAETQQTLRGLDRQLQSLISGVNRCAED